MKLACASRAFDRDLSSGDLTQLEWLDLCARELAADGVVCDVRHFPRRDSDYLAQIKKMAVDLGLSIAAVSCEDFFAGDEGSMRDVLAVADLIGAPIVSAPLGMDTASTWSAELARLGAATSLAKTMNVTLAVRNAPNTFAATSADLKRVSKESDSAWLRYALDVSAFDMASDVKALASRTVLYWHEPPRDATEGAKSQASERLLDAAAKFRGFLVLDAGDGSATVNTMRTVMRTWQTILAEETLGDAL
ncbi:MAG: hypothetical protein NVSMB31_12980 [Vulcanimicrobiaceae bacterium]